MTSRTFRFFLAPFQPSVRQIWVFYLQLHTYHHKSDNPLSTYLRDVIYEQPPTLLKTVSDWVPLLLKAFHKFGSFI